MEYLPYKPLGSIIKIRGLNKKLMIIQRATATSLNPGENKQFFDYGCVLYPEGLISDRLIYIQDSDIDNVIFEGFSDKENEEILKRLESNMSKIDFKRADTTKYIDAMQKLNQKEQNKR